MWPPPPIVPVPPSDVLARPHHPENDTGGGTDGGAPLEHRAACTMDSECGATACAPPRWVLAFPRLLQVQCDVRTPTAARAPTASPSGVMTAVCVKTCTPERLRMGSACAGSFLGGTRLRRQGLRARNPNAPSAMLHRRRRLPARGACLARPPAPMGYCIVSCRPDDRRLLRDLRRVITGNQGAASA